MMKWMFIKIEFNNSYLKKSSNEIKKRNEWIQTVTETAFYSIGISFQPRLRKFYFPFSLLQLSKLFLYVDQTLYIGIPVADLRIGSLNANINHPTPERSL